MLMSVFGFNSYTLLSAAKLKTNSPKKIIKVITKGNDNFDV